jgi:hypothetical protein
MLTIVAGEQTFGEDEATPTTPWHQGNTFDRA